MKRFSLFSLAGGFGYSPAYDRVVILLLSGLIFLPLAFSQTTNETLTISTYYPSPYGVYSEMRLYPKADATCNPDQIGLMYYDNTPGEEGLKVCGGSPPVWQGIGSYWTLLSNNLYPTNTTSWNVGIGTASPATALDVKGTLTMRAPDGGVGGTLQSVSTSGSLVYSPAGSGGYSAVHIFKNRIGGDIMLLDGTGDVGIGTTVPGVKLDVAGSRVVGIRYLKSGSKDSRIQVGDPTKVWGLAVGWATAGDFSIIEEGVAGDRLYIKQGGNVGIGTTSPAAPLHIANNIPTIIVQDLDSAGVNSWGTILFRDSAGSNTAYIGRGGGLGKLTISNFNPAPITFAYGDTDRVSILHTGEVGIGTTGPTEKLDVNGKARFRGGIQMGGVQSSVACSGTPPVSCSNVTPVGTRYDFCALSMMGGRDGAECEVSDLGGGQWRVDGRNSFGTTVKCTMRCFNYY